MTRWWVWALAGMLAGAGAHATGPEQGGEAMADGKTVDLCEQGLEAWRATGEWAVVGAVRVDPANPRRLVGEPGEGILLNGPDGITIDLLSKAAYGDVRAHIEFMVPEGSNSGVYFQGRYEIQILDSWGVEEPTFGDCGGIYQRWDEDRDPHGYEGHAPRVNAARPPGEWQTFDVVFRAPRFNEHGEKVANAEFVEIVHNGVVVHENVEVTGPTRASTFSDEAPEGPIMLQGDHGPVAYRAVRITPLGEPEAAGE